MSKKKYAELIANLKYLKNKIEKTPKQISEEIGPLAKEEIKKQLELQREDKVPPPLSDATQKLRQSEKERANLHEKLLITRRNTTKGFKIEIKFADEESNTVASVQEKGAIIPVTNKMRGYLATRGIFLKKETFVIIVPGRKFFSKSMKNLKKRIRHEILKRIKK